ncbi:oxidoreductase [Dactylonectria macrodidyma]|uniref:Oxidoreductase n=1 Tax=Dactylonectria macrodidyma TaxID=307937 RepID=A0A9P9EPI7_9HYPO|nr:oxidoreductase [Dactylonectria macrodidyma]
MSHPGRLEGKVAIVTGGGAGFGVGIVNKFTFEGAKVVVLDIVEERAKNIAAAQPKDSAIGMKGDVSLEADWKAAIDVAVKKFGKLDIIVNNAGVVYNACRSIDTTEADYDRVMRVNLKSLYWSSNVAIPYFIAEGRGGLFVNISSMSSPRPRPNLVWYGASKGGLTNATKGLAIEWAKDKIRFNVIHPVAGETNMVPFFLGGKDSQEGRDGFISTIPLGRFAQPEDIGNAVAFLASDEASMITGASLDVDGGRGI